jgi:hypothetical protein
MTLSLQSAFLFPGISLFVLGTLLLCNRNAIQYAAKKSLRSKTLALLMLTIGTGWFLFYITQLGEADFGNYKHWLFLVFSSIAVLSFFFVPDFLSVRAIAIVVLLSAYVLLKAAWMQFHYPERLWMVGFVYVCIVLALYFGAVPYKLRNFFDWLFAKKKRTRALGLIFSLYGLFLCSLALRI